MGTSTRTWITYAVVSLLVLVSVFVCWRQLAHRKWLRSDPDSPEAIERHLYSALKKNHVIDYPDLGYSLSVENVRGNMLLNPLLRRLNARGKDEMVIRCRTGDLHVHPDRKYLVLHLQHGTAFWENNEAVFDEKTLELPLPDAQ